MQTVLATLMEVAATLACLDLVFLGIVCSTLQANRDLHRGASPRHHRALALGGLGSFDVGVLAVAVAGVALLVPAAQAVLLPVVVVRFFARLVVLVALAAQAVR